MPGFLLSQGRFRLKHPLDLPGKPGALGETKGANGAHQPVGLLLRRLPDVFAAGPFRESPGCGLQPCHPVDDLTLAPLPERGDGVRDLLPVSGLHESQPRVSATWPGSVNGSNGFAITPDTPSSA